MEDLFDLLFDLFGWILPLLGKFWLLILALIGYKLFGKNAKKMSQGMPRRALTPVENPDLQSPAAPQEGRQVRASAKYEPVEPVSMEGVGVEQEWAFAEPDHSQHIRESKPPSAAAEEQASSALPNLDPRDGMKWAIIFGEPRAKAPHGSCAARRRNA